MDSVRHVLAQILDLVHRETLSRLVSIGNERQCGEDANLDSSIALFDGGNPSQKPKTTWKPSQYFADFEYSPVLY
jgi:hypothetical protein